MDISNHGTYSIISRCFMAGCVGCTLRCLAIITEYLCLRKISHRNAPKYHYAQNQLVEKVLEVVRGIQVIKAFLKKIRV